MKSNVLSRNLTTQALHYLPTRPLPGKSEHTTQGSKGELCKGLLTNAAVPPMVPSSLRPVGAAGVVCDKKLVNWASAMLTLHSDRWCSAMPTKSAEEEEEEEAWKLATLGPYFSMFWKWKSTWSHALGPFLLNQPLAKSNCRKANTNININAAGRVACCTVVLCLRFCSGGSFALRP